MSIIITIIFCILICCILYYFGFKTGYNKGFEDCRQIYEDLIDNDNYCDDTNNV